MKSTITFLAALLFFCVASAQNNYINYKALVKDNLGNVVANQSIDVRFTVFADAAQVYLETHNPTTDANGIIILDIGSGTTVDTFTAIDWSTNTSLKTEMDTGSGYVDLGTTEFKSVPYALTAGNTVFSTTNNVTSNANGVINVDDFVFGSTQLEHSANLSINDSRMFFDKSKIAFRAGSTINSNQPFPNDGTAWNANRIGFYSFASGNNTVAYGDYSTAFGLSTRAFGKNATVMGYNTLAQAYGSTAIGLYNIGDFINNVAPDPLNPLFEIGNGTSDANRTNALTVLYNGSISAPSFDLAEITDPKALVTKEYADGLASELEQITEGGNTGYRLKGSDPTNYGNIGERAIDFSESFDPSTNGATGEYSFAAGINVISSGRTSFAFGDEAKANMDYSIAIGAIAEATKDHATAIGNFSKATGTGSVAIGDTQATGPYSRSFGYGANSSANHSTALGYYTKAESYLSTAIGSYNIGGGNSSTGWDNFDPLFEIGNGTDGNRSNALTVLKNGLLTAPSLTTTMITDEASGQVLVTKAYADAQAGALSTTNNITSNAPGDIDTDDFVFGSDQLHHSAVRVSAGNDDSRMMFYKNIAAFRVGATRAVAGPPFDGSDWNETNVGAYSFASGFATRATNTYTIAMGHRTQANGEYAIALGNQSVANGRYSASIGHNTTTSSYASIALGSLNVGGGSSTSWVETDPIFEIGNGTSLDNRSNAMTVLKNGNSQISGRLSIGTNTIGYLGSLAIKGDNNNDMIQLIDNNDNNKWHIGLKSSGDDISFSESLVADGRLYLQKGGNVGINTTSPANRLVVKGNSSNIEISNTEETEAGIIFNDSGDTVNQQASIMYDSNGSGNNLYIRSGGNQAILIDDNTNVTIGGLFNNATYGKLNVVSNSMQLALAKSDLDNERWEFNINGTNDLEFRNSSALRGIFNKNTGAYTQVSDRRVKTNIHSLEPVLEKVLLLQPSRYNYINKEPLQTESIGFIAQDVKEIFPEFVIVNQDGKRLHSLDYAGLSVIAIKAIKEQQLLIEAQNKRIASLEEQNKELQEDTIALATLKKDIELIKLQLGLLATKSTAPLTAKN